MLRSLVRQTALTLLVLLVASPAVRAQDADIPAIHATFFLDVRQDGHTTGVVTVDPAASVRSVNIFFNDGSAVPATPMGSGIWEASAALSGTDTCHDGVAEILLGEREDTSKLCLEKLEITHTPTGETYTVFGGALKSNTTFTASNGDRANFHTSCSQCLREGQTDGNFEITELIAAGRLIEKCEKEDGIASGATAKKVKKPKKNVLDKLLKKDVLLIELGASACKPRPLCFQPG